VIVSAWSILSFPSVTTVGMIISGVAGALARRRDGADEGVRRSTFPLIAIFGIALYATTIGSPSFNLYRVGFSPLAPLVLAILAALVARKQPVVAVIALAVLLAYDLHLYRSRNLLDYALDPILVAVATGWCVRRMVVGYRLSVVRGKPTTDN
jgi:hypothetical protein